MKYKVNFFETNDGKIILHIKKPLFKTTQEMLSYFDYKFNIGDYPEHNDRYLKQCLYNLQEKADRGIITKEEWQLIYDNFKEYLD